MNYGPVNYESYKSMQMLFLGLDEKDKYLLKPDEAKEINAKYGKYFDKLNKLSSFKLVEESHKNKAWIKARNGLVPYEPSDNKIDEQSRFFKIHCIMNKSVIDLKYFQFKSFFYN